MKFQSKFTHFHSRKYIWKYRLRNGGHFDSVTCYRYMYIGLSHKVSVSDFDVFISVYGGLSCFVIFPIFIWIQSPKSYRNYHRRCWKTNKIPWKIASNERVTLLFKPLSSILFRLTLLSTHILINVLCAGNVWSKGVKRLWLDTYFCISVQVASSTRWYNQYLDNHTPG